MDDRRDYSQRDAIEAARERLTLHPTNRVRFKPRALHDTLRYLSPGQFWVGAAHTGIGKTTFTLSVINDWVEAGIKVCLVPTELEDTEVRRDIACLRAGVDKQVAIENSWDEHPDGLEMLERVDEELYAQGSGVFADNLLILPYRELDENLVLEAAGEAGKFGAKVLVVDHLDHVDYEGRQAFGLAGRLAQAMKHGAEEYDLTAFGLKQIHSEAAKGDPLARYLPPQLHQLQGGYLTGQNAVVVFGLYRPLLPLSGKEGEATLRGVRAKLIEPTSLLMRNTMGVVVLKHRPQGRLEGRRCLLHVENGRVTDRDTY